MPSDLCHTNRFSLVGECAAHRDQAERDLREMSSAMSQWNSLAARSRT